MPKKQNEGKIYAVIKPTAELLGDPANGAVIGKNDSQLLFGESFRVQSRDRLWFYGTSLTDGYKGYIHRSALKLQTRKTTHIVAGVHSHIYPAPDFKTRPLMALGFMSRVHVASGFVKNGFVKTGHGWIFKDHLQKISALKQNKDHVAAALKFLGSPYLYGGRSAAGLDCSGLVQLALSFCGHPCPRDSNQQTILGRKIPAKNLRRGDLVFFRGHVGLMVDSKNILNATARTMDVRIESLSNLIPIYKGITAARRL